MMAKTINLLPNCAYAIGNHHGRNVYMVSHVATKEFRNVAEAAGVLCRVGANEFVLRGGLVKGLGSQFRRLLHAKPNARATIVDVARSYVILDIDGAPEVIPWYDPLTSDAEWATAAVDELIRDILPPEFHGANGWFRFTGRHGVKPGMNLRLLFCLTRPLETKELKAWLGHLRHRKVDTAVFSPVQQILIANPILPKGVNDIVKVRSGFVCGPKNLVVPPAAEVLRALPHRRQTAISAKTSSSAASGSNNAAPKPPRGAVGYCSKLARIGDGADQDGIHNAILAVVGTWVWLNGWDADPSTLIADITHQIETAVIDHSKHNAAYIAAELAALPGLINGVCAMEREKQASLAAAAAARKRDCIPARHELIKTTVDDAAQQAQVAIAKFVANVKKLKRLRDTTWNLSQTRGFGRDYPAPFEPTDWRPRGAVMVDVGVGKTGVVIDEIKPLVFNNPDLRVAYIVPAHKLANDVQSRINTKAGSHIAEIWRGLNQPDPNDLSVQMCRRAEDVYVVQRAGGEVSDLCGSQQRGFCPFYPNQGGKCAYIMQKRLKPRVWIGTAAMLTNAVPRAMQRDAVPFQTGDKAHAATPPAFDLVVLDEAPFLTLMGGFDEGSKVVVSTAWLDPTFYLSPPGEKQAEHDAVIKSALLALNKMVQALLAGGEALRDYYAVESAIDITPQSPEFTRAADLLGAVPGRMKIDPTITGNELVNHLDQRVQEMSRVRSVQRLLRLHDGILSGVTAIGCVEKAEMPSGTPAIRLRWREQLAPSWLDCPVLYLDGTAKIRLAERWLGKIETLVVAKAATPHMRIVHVDDRAFGYGSIIAGDDSAAAKTAKGHQKRLSDLMAVAQAGTGGVGVLMAPKELVAQMQSSNWLPQGWVSATFGSLRGVDDFKDVSVAVIVSRPLPSPANVELMAQVIFGAAVSQIEGDWYPSTSTSRLMIDGTGRQAEVICHPDADVEIVRWTICEAEVLQAIGRVRGVRRDHTNPVVVYVLSDVDLGDLPISELTTWDALRVECGPVMLMAAQGVVPQNWTDIAHMIGRWNGANDPALNARGWFRDNPDQQALLDDLFLTDKIRNPLTGTETKFRRETLGLIGRNRRYVWLAESTTVDDARKLLP